MNQQQIKQFLTRWEDKRARTLVIIDFANVEKWRESLNWKVGIPQLSNLVRCFSNGDKQLRRFYYGSDYGQNDNSTVLSDWSDRMIKLAKYNNMEVVTKRVKYIHDNSQDSGFVRKCDLDVEMAIDMVKYHDRYDDIVLFSGDGDLVYALKYVKQTYSKRLYAFGSRDHIGREIVDAKNSGVIEKIFFAEDFEYRLSLNRQR